MDIAALSLAALISAKKNVSPADKHISDNNIYAITRLLNKNIDINKKLLLSAYSAYLYEKSQGYIKRPILTVINFGLPSDKKRLWVINLKTGTILSHSLVAQGLNTGRGAVAKRFSNKIGSLESSLGAFVTKGTYYGHDGYSMRVSGLEPGVNNNAERRHIVMHPAKYVSESIAHEYGRVGNTWGCFGLPPSKARIIINEIDHGTMMYVVNKPNQDYI